ncbi:DUF3237 domain-containing protein [Aspergillus ruber CBS 135680]|uniref:Uncharacterized protein n=1 Tax=Aspergillus ruber (strain CBS 135680) TaxID=1388766 RepID=A0A017SGF8_ASPRC|nr:uncharacterized protein EURHEDRAFT_499984 [Aspergillus ruber CBS 135680]EYE95380.1 hypothetical protein EURHEDRAFT_499984 [Aspergillus ruber CBS 135680]
MPGFPSIKPAFTVQVGLPTHISAGSASRTANLMVVPMLGNILKSDPAFEPTIDAEFVGVGNDYIHADPDGQHLRLNAHGVLKATSQLLYINYTDVVAMGPAEQAVFGDTASDGATLFGNSFTHFTFETDNARYKELENHVFVGQGWFRTEKGKPIVVEYKVGRVVSS